MMNLKPVQLQLSVKDVSEILQTSLDEYREHDLHFIRNVIVKKIEKALPWH